MLFFFSLSLSGGRRGEGRRGGLIMIYVNFNYMYWCYIWVLGMNDQIFGFEGCNPALTVMSFVAFHIFVTMLISFMFLYQSRKSFTVGFKDSKSTGLE